MAAEEKKEIVEKVKQIISEQLGVDENEVTPSASFVDDLGADSLDQVELVMALEEHFDVEIPGRGRGEAPHRAGCHRLHRQARQSKQVEACAEMFSDCAAAAGDIPRQPGEL